MACEMPSTPAVRWHSGPIPEFGPCLNFAVEKRERPLHYLLVLPDLDFGGPAIVILLLLGAISLFTHLGLILGAVLIARRAPRWIGGSLVISTALMGVAGLAPVIASRILPVAQFAQLMQWMSYPSLAARTLFTIGFLGLGWQIIHQNILIHPQQRR